MFLTWPREDAEAVRTETLHLSGLMSNTKLYLDSELAEELQSLFHGLWKMRSPVWFFAVLYPDKPLPEAQKTEMQDWLDTKSAEAKKELRGIEVRFRQMLGSEFASSSSK